MNPHCTNGAASAAPDLEDRRRICEARDWLRRGYTRPKPVAELMARIAAKRGEQAAQELREEMRRQWSNRNEWQGSQE